RGEVRIVELRIEVRGAAQVVGRLSIVGVAEPVCQSQVAPDAEFILHIRLRGVLTNAVMEILLRLGEGLDVPQQKAGPLLLEGRRGEWIIENRRIRVGIKAEETEAAVAGISASVIFILLITAVGEADLERVLA